MALQDKDPRPNSASKTNSERIKTNREKTAALLKSGWILLSDVPFKLERLFRASVGTMDKFFAAIVKGLTPEETEEKITSVSRSRFVSSDFYNEIVKKAEEQFKRR